MKRIFKIAEKAIRIETHGAYSANLNNDILEGVKNELLKLEGVDTEIISRINSKIENNNILIKKSASIRDGADF
ncbi:hypothetical protein [Flavobacterium rhizosphaerae]|uniref:Uncharacterized protein n=1 Tax=Flavobacterium rhizosphaerae TaxID=3163298 RepID=A0ABW8YYG6_9FLAO